MAENKKLSAIVELIKEEAGYMWEHNGTTGDGPLVYLTQKQAEIAVYLGAPIGVRSTDCGYHGSHKGRYDYDSIDTMESLNSCLKREYMEKRASISPYLPSPNKVLGYIKQVEEMNLPAHEIKAAGGYGLKQLHRLASTIEHSTDGKQQCVGSSMGGVYIRPDENANIGLMMRKNLDYETGLCSLEFQGYVRRMGVYMSSEEMQEIADEIGQITNVLARFEQYPIVVTEEEMAQWSKELAEMELEREQTVAEDMEQQLDCQTGSVHTMGMM